MRVVILNFSLLSTKPVKIAASNKYCLYILILIYTTPLLLFIVVLLKEPQLCNTVAPADMFLDYNDQGRSSLF